MKALTSAILLQAMTLVSYNIQAGPSNGLVDPEILHDDSITIPVNTPFFSTFQMRNDLPHVWRLSFMILIPKDHFVVFEDKSTSDPFIDRWWRIHVRADTLNVAAPEYTLDGWLKKDGAVLKRVSTTLTMDGINYELCTFVKYLRKNTNSADIPVPFAVGELPTDYIMKFRIGDHKQHPANKTHQGGMVHKPEG